MDPLSQKNALTQKNSGTQIRNLSLVKSMEQTGLTKKKKKDITAVSNTNQEYPIPPIHICRISLLSDVVIIISE